MKLQSGTYVDFPVLTRTESYLLVISFAFFTHQYFRKYDVKPANIAAVILSLALLPALLSVVTIRLFSSTTHAFLVSYALFYLSLSAFTVLYRLSPFHPLARYPGPRLAKVSKFWSLRMAKGGKLHIHFKHLHEKYGPVVRVGPNELTFSEAEAVSAALGGEGMTKGPLWEARRAPTGPVNLLGIRNPHEHAQRRKLWTRAFTTASVKEYEPTLVRRVQQLVDQLEANVSGETDLARWLSFFTFDFMGDMMFGGGFELMRDGDRDQLWQLMESGLKNLALLQNIPWAAPILWKLPAASKRIVRLRTYAINCVKSRKQKGSMVMDVFHHLIDEEGLEEESPTEDVVVADAVVAIVAGADTTASAMAGIFYYLLSHPHVYKRLQAEVDETFPLIEGHPYDAAKLAKMEYLNAVINEALRLQPPVPVSVQRSPLPGSGGKWVGEHFVPEGTAIDVPMYVLHRDPRYFFPYPDSFMPERWLSESSTSEKVHDEEKPTRKFITNNQAFAPFAAGPSNCVGKNLAVVEMRMVVALLVQRFEMRFAEGYDAARAWEEALEDWFVMKTGKLPVVLAPRN